MFFDAKKGTERKSVRVPAAEGEQQGQELKLAVNQAFAEGKGTPIALDAVR